MGCFIFILISIPILVIIAIWNIFQRYEEEKTLFQSTIPASRVDFLNDIWGLTADECNQLHFDGYDFHLPLISSVYIKQCLYNEFTSISLLNIERVKVKSSIVPHKTTWLHRRIDGGPDRRYNFNREIRFSFRFRVRFNGTNSYTLVGYMAYDNIKRTVEKFNNLLRDSKVINFESKFDEYAEVHKIVQKTQELLNNARTKKSEVESALGAFRRLSDIEFDDDMSSKYRKANSELSRLKEEISNLQKNISSGTNRMASIVRNIQDDLAHFQDLEICKKAFEDLD